jgi:hypothetical protein
MLSIQIDNFHIRLLQPKPNLLKLTIAQAEVYQVLWAIASIKGDRPNQIREAVLLELLQLNHREALVRRLVNLEGKNLLTLELKKQTA